MTAGRRVLTEEERLALLLYIEKESNLQLAEEVFQMRKREALDQLAQLKGQYAFLSNQVVLKYDKENDVHFIEPC